MPLTGVSPSRASVDAVLAAHQTAVRPFSAAGVGSVVLEAGPPDGHSVLCLHGVPTSSFLYRKVVGELAARGLRGLAVDLPGLGLADRPADFDYSWTGLGRWAAAAVQALDLSRFSLVVHDIGGPVGFELASRLTDRVASLTLLNTVVAVERFRRPPPMEPYAHRVLGELWLAGTRPGIFAAASAAALVEDRSQVSRAELDAYLRLLKRGDGGRAFLRIMRGFERTPEKGRLYRQVVGDPGRPRAVVWGVHDPALPLRSSGRDASEIAGVALQPVAGRHLLQEDCAPAIADAVARLVA